MSLNSYPKTEGGEYVIPQSESEIIAMLDDPMARLCSGFIYKIMVKSDRGDGDYVIPFVPNAAQIRLIDNLHNRNVILKARQRLHYACRDHVA